MSQSESVDNVIIERCKEENNKLFLVNKEEIKNYSYTEEYQKFDYKEFKNIEIKLKGISQIYNACITLETVNVIKEKYNIKEEIIRKWQAVPLTKKNREQWAEVISWLQGMAF